MLKLRRLMQNTLILTIASFLMQAVGLTFQAFLTRRIGAAGVGLFLLTMSVNSFAATVAITGVRFATMRIVSQEMGVGCGEGALTSVRHSLIYAAFFGALSASLLGLGAEYIGTKLIGDVRTVRPLRYLAMSLPFMSMATVFTGYFTAVGKIYFATAKGFIEQVIRITVSAALLGNVKAGDVEEACVSVILGGVAGEVGSFLLIAAAYVIESRPLRGKGNAPENLVKRLFSIAIPLGIAAYARTALNAAKNLLTPRAMSRYGVGAELAMADYGMIQGMVFPVIMFPSALIASLAELLIPEITKLQANGKNSEISSAANRILCCCMLFSVGVAGTIFTFSGSISSAVYGNTDSAHFIELFSILIPVIYMDMITDSLLKGLGKQVYSMRINVCDSLISTLLIMLILPRFGLHGYVFVLFFSEIFNFALSLWKLYKITNLHFQAADIMYSACLIAVCSASAFVLYCASKGGNGALCISILLCAAAYVIGLMRLNVLPSNLQT